MPRDGRDPFVGRARELTRLRAAADRAASREAQTVLVEGAPGVGATRLVHHFAEDLAGVTVIFASAARGEGHVPYGLAGQVIRALDPGHAGWLPADLPAFAVGAQFLDALAAAEERAPVLLVLDDMQWADDDSLAALRFALRRLGAERVLVLLVGRRGRGTWDGLEARHDWPERLERIDLEGLGESEVAELLRASGREVVEGPVLRRITHLTEGNSLHLRALLSAPAAETDDLLLGRVEVVPSLTTTLQTVLASFRPAERAVLEALAVFAEPASAADLAALSGDPRAADVIESLGATGLVRWNRREAPPRAMFTNEAWRAAVEAGLAPERRAALHRVAAELAAGPSRWRHLAAIATRGDPALAAELVRAADAETAARRFGVAAQYLLWARSAAPTRAESDALLVQAVRLLVFGGARGADVLHRDVDALPASPARTEALALLSLSAGRIASARDLLLHARAESEAASDTAATADIDVGLAGANWLLGLGQATVDASDHALAAEHPRWPELASAFRAFGIALATDAAAGLEALGGLPEVPTGCTTTEIPALTQRGVLRSLVGRFDEAAADLTVAAQRRTGFVGFLEARAHVHLIWCRYLRAEWDDAQRAIGVAFQAAEQHGHPMDHARLWCLSAMLRAGRGDPDTASAEVALATELAGDSDYLGPVLHLAVARAAIAQASGSPALVIDAIGRLSRGTTEPDRARLFGARWLPLLGDAQIAIGDLPGARLTIARLRELVAEDADLPVILARLDGGVAAAEGDPERATAVFAAGLALRADHSEPAWNRALLREAAGTHLLAQRDDRAGVAELRRAAAAFRRIGATPFLERTQARLDEHVSRPPAWHRDLTDRERDVARLVGRGWTSREIATELYVSVKTVDYHLGNIYGKLGITSRRELRDLVQDEES